jgi:hypothetical protein
MAWLNAVITVGGDAPEEEFKKAMLDFKEETGQIIEDVVQQIIDEQNSQEETPPVDPLPFEEEE